MDRIWRPEDFVHFILEKNLDFDYHIDIADLLSDKSIIPKKPNRYMNMINRLIALSTAFFRKDQLLPPKV